MRFTVAIRFVACFGRFPRKRIREQKRAFERAEAHADAARLRGFVKRQSERRHEALELGALRQKERRLHLWALVGCGAAARRA